VKKEPKLQLIRGVSSRFVYLAMDTERAVTPFITDREGKPLPAIRCTICGCARRCRWALNAKPSSSA